MTAPWATGLVTELLTRRLDGAEVYACGPPPMLEAVRGDLRRAGVPAQLAMESGMACGFGACFGCVVPTGGLHPPVRRRSGARRRRLETAQTPGAGTVPARGISSAASSSAAPS